MDELRGKLRDRRADLIDRWHRQVLATAEAGFALDPGTIAVLPDLLDALDRVLVKKFRPPPADPVEASAWKAAMRSSLLGDYLFDAALELAPDLGEAGERALSGSLAQAAVEVLVRNALVRDRAGRRREVHRFTRLAHELRDAMTGAQLALDLLRSRRALPDSTAAAALHTSLRRLRNGLEDAALDELIGVSHLRQDKVRLGPVVASCPSTARALGAKTKGLEVLAERSRLCVRGDPRIVGPAVRGLLRAAIDVARPNSIIRVDTQPVRRRNRVRVIAEKSRSANGTGEPRIGPVRRAARSQGGIAAARLFHSHWILTLELPAAG